ncbi:MAG TPA: IclR family transcriptional regulator [Burkholderiaceae bacterium]|nr:IclR family transcriptional regulator [Burkholderiaceae bacterium]
MPSSRSRTTPPASTRARADLASAQPLQAGIQSVEVGFALLAVLADARGPMMLRDLARAAGMSAAKAHRYLVSFQRLELVAQEPATSHYDLGPGALRLGLAGLARLDAVKLARSVAQRLCAQINHTTAVAVWGNHGPTIVHWEESRQPVSASLRLGDVMPLLNSATGRCFAAFLPREVTWPIARAELASIGQARDLPRSPSAFDEWTARIRRRGAGAVQGELLPGISALCHPVFDSDGHLALGLVSLGPSATFDASEGSSLDMAMQQAAGELSHQLGHPLVHEPVQGVQR